jgi:putative transposase
MVAILFAIISIFAFRLRSRAALELKLVAIEHQLAVLRRQRPGRPQLSSLDRLLWVLLYRIRPKVIDAMVLVRPATVVEWHRRGFRFYWCWRSRRPGRPRINPEIRDLIRRMSKANPLWGAPRIHGELLKRHQHQPGHGRAVDALASQGPVPDLAELSAQPPAGNCGN